MRSNSGSDSAAPSWIVVIDATARRDARRAARGGEREGPGAVHRPRVTDGPLPNRTTPRATTVPSWPIDDCRHRRSPARRRGAGGPRAPAARRPGAPRLQLPLVLDPGRPRAVRVDRPRALGALRGEPRPPARRGRRRRRSSARRPTPRCSSGIAAVEAAVRADLARPVADGPASAEHPIAYFCAEFGVHRSLPVYSGGLGALAGDILKEASDRALPLAAIGLMYRQGYFRQRIDAGGWQHEYWVDTDPERLPAALVTGADGEPLTMTVPVRDMQVTAQIWRVDVGRVPLYLLDAERPGERPRGALDHVAPVHRRAGRAAGAVHPARRRRHPRARRAGHRARPPPPQRGPRRVHGARAGARPRRPARRRPRGRARQDDLHHPHAGPGGQRHLPGRAGRRGAAAA